MQRLFEARVLFQQSFELFVLVRRIAFDEREGRGQYREHAGQDDQVVADVEGDFDLFASLGTRHVLLIVHAFAYPEAEAVDGQAEENGEHVENAVSADHFGARLHAADRVEHEADAGGEDGEKDEGDDGAHYQEDLAVRAILQYCSVWQNKTVNRYLGLFNKTRLVSVLKTTGCKEVGHANVIQITSAAAQIEPARLHQRHGQDGDAKDGAAGRKQVALALLVGICKQAEACGRSGQGECISARRRTAWTATAAAAACGRRRRCGSLALTQVVIHQRDMVAQMAVAIG